MQERQTKPSTNPYPWSKEARHFGILWGTEIGQLFSWPLVDETDAYDAEAGVIASAVGAMIGVLVIAGQLIYKRIKKVKRSQKTSLDDKLILVQKPSLLPEDKNNVIHNRAKAGATSGAGFGGVIGAALGAVLPIPLAEKLLMLLGSAIGGTLGGLIAIIIPWWVPPEIDPKPQANPVSERLRSGAMLGSCVGIVFGAFVLAALTPWGFPLCILLGIGLGTTLFSIAAYCLDESWFIEEESNASNPWTKRLRAGVQWGAFVGILVGILLPGLGIGLSTMLSVVVGGALFSIGGCILALAVEPVLNKIIPALCGGKNYETVNPWGPRARCGSFYGSWIGMLIGCCIFPGFIGATLGGAIGGLIGGLAAVLIEPLYLSWRGYYSMKENDPEKKRIDSEDLSCSSGNQWSERCRTGAQIGAALGALIGFFAFPPFGLFFGSAIGGILGGGIAFLISADWNHKDAPDVPQDYPNIQETSSEYRTADEEEMFPLLYKPATSNDATIEGKKETLPEPSFCVLL